MHLLAAKPGNIHEGDEAIDLGQTRGNIVVLSAADTDILSMDQAQQRRTEPRKSLRLANIMRLSHPYSIDLYCENIIAHARIIIIRCLGGRSYWTYGIDEIHRLCKANDKTLILLPGDNRFDEELHELSLCNDTDYHSIWQYFLHGGAANFDNIIAWCNDERPSAPIIPPDAGIFKSNIIDQSKPIAYVIFYRSLLQADDTKTIDAVHQAFDDLAINCVSIYATSLKSPKAMAIIEQELNGKSIGCIINITSFAIANPGDNQDIPALYRLADCPVLQAIHATRSEEQWQASSQGLPARDIAMNVALPEIDGRIITFLVGFKQSLGMSDITQTDRIGYAPHTHGIANICALAKAWINLRTTTPKNRKLAIVLANYPNKDGRIGNGVGLDTPASLHLIINALKKNGYSIDNVDKFASGQDIISHILQGPTNAQWQGRDVRISLALARYQQLFATVPDEMQAAINDRWGPVQDDPCFMSDQNALALSIFEMGNICIGVQPARGYNIDPQRTYHDPDLIPPHGYLAFYLWLRAEFAANAIIQLGKHGNLEWLPGKALALSDQCYPLAVLGPMPMIYPFIVNDPGEGSQAKRRNAAVVIDHMTPPLSQSGIYGHMDKLETLIDEYFTATQLDPRRLRLLGENIIALAISQNLAKECGIDESQDIEAQLQTLDAYLCEIKDLQIRAGLHCFGAISDDLDELLFAFAKMPRTLMHQAKTAQTANCPPDAQQSIMRAIADDLALDFDPLIVDDLAQPWQGPKHEALKAISNDIWRTYGDCVARISALAKAIIANDHDVVGPNSNAVCAWVADTLKPNLQACAQAETNGLLRALDARYVPAGPSGAPSRGRVDVLPTGRNFYSVDTRAVPTPAAWHLGWQSANRVIETYAQTNGAPPRHIGLNIWGTANMRTGGDDIAQALALIGARPVWDAAGYRVEGYEILPIDTLDRNRVDVTLRISGFFRDAFPNLITLFDKAQREIAQLDEPFSQNALAERYANRLQALRPIQTDEKLAQLSAGDAIFGSMPGAYGAGLQALIDAGEWQDTSELAEAYISWSKYAYRADSGGGDGAFVADSEFRARLETIQLVMQNQDNREHDILDSDDYYQFEGGMIAAIKHISGASPEAYHNDHSNPEHTKIMTLQSEISRTMRARALNPKWITAMQSHGYKGAFEMEATVDYLFAFSATTGLVKSYQFDDIFSAYLGDETNLEFLRENNPDALKAIAKRLVEAQTRGLWQTRLNHADKLLHTLLHK